MLCLPPAPDITQASCVIVRHSYTPLNAAKPCKSGVGRSTPSPRHRQRHRLCTITQCHYSRTTFLSIEVCIGAQALVTIYANPPSPPFRRHFPPDIKTNPMMSNRQPFGRKLTVDGPHLSHLPYVGPSGPRGKLRTEYDVATPLSPGSRCGFQKETSRQVRQRGVPTSYGANVPCTSHRGGVCTPLVNLLCRWRCASANTNDTRQLLIRFVTPSISDSNHVYSVRRYHYPGLWTTPATRIWRSASDLCDNL